MNTANLRRLLDEATPRPWKDADIFYYVIAATERKDAALIIELVNNADELLAENERLKSLLADWQEFGKDVITGDPAGQDWLDELRGRTKAALEQKP